MATVISHYLLPKFKQRRACTPPHTGGPCRAHPSDSPARQYIRNVPRSTRNMYTDECRTGTPDIPAPASPTGPRRPYHSLLHGAKPGGAILPRDRRAAAPDVAHLGHRALARARRGAHRALALEGVEDLRHRGRPSASWCRTKICVCARQARTYRDQRRVGFHGCQARGYAAR